MNQYVFLSGSKSDGWSAADAKKVSQVLGYMALMGQEFAVTSFPSALGVVDQTIVRAATPFRMPSYLAVTPGGGFVGTIANATLIALSVADAQASQQLNNMERAQVNQGDFCCVVCPVDVSVDDQLVNSTAVYMGCGSVNGGATVYFGQASQTAQQGTYQNPFLNNGALAFTNFGSLTSIAGLVAGGAAPVLPQLPQGTPVPATATAVSIAARTR